MHSPQTFGNRPVLSSGTNPKPDTFHPEAMDYGNRISHTICNFLARTVSKRSLSELALQASMRSLMMLPLLGKGLATRHAESASADLLQNETRRVMKGGYKRQARLNVLMSSRTPISLTQAREIYTKALAGEYRGDDKLLWNAVLRFHEEADEAEVKDKLQQLLSLTLPEEMLERLKEYDAARKQGDVDPAAFADVFQGANVDEAGRNALQMVVERVRDIALIDQFIANGARLGLHDQNGDTEVEIAQKSGDYFLATKLKLALNYQALKDRLEEDKDPASECAIVAYQFDEEKMSYETAAKKLFQYLDKNPHAAYTHGALVCRHEDGRVTSRLVHSSCPLREDTTITSVCGDICVPAFVRQMKEQTASEQPLTRRPLHPERATAGAEQAKRRTLGNRLLWGSLKGLQYGALSYLVESAPAAGVSGVCGAIISLQQIEDDKDFLRAEKFGMFLGGGIGSAMGVPFMGAQIGNFLVHCLKPLSGAAIHAIGQECERNEDAIDGLLMTGGVLYVANATGEYAALSASTLQTLYGAATGIVMPAAMFVQNMENPYFRKFAAAMVLLSFTGIGAASVCALAGETALLASAFTMAGGVASKLTPSLPVLRGVLLAQGALSYCQWDVSNLLSTVADTGRLFTGMLGRVIPIVSSNFSRHVDPTATQDEYSELETASDRSSSSASNSRASHVSLTDEIPLGRLIFDRRRFQRPSFMRLRFVDDHFAPDAPDGLLREAGAELEAEDDVVAEILLQRPDNEQSEDLHLEQSDSSEQGSEAVAAVNDSDRPRAAGRMRTRRTASHRYDPLGLSLVVNEQELHASGYLLRRRIR